VGGGTATAEVDYGLPDGSVTFPVGTTSLNIEATIIDDAADEPDETLLVRLRVKSRDARLRSPRPTNTRSRTTMRRQAAGAVARSRRSSAHLATTTFPVRPATTSSTVSVATTVSTATAETT
jgi:hypothetical protein